jgi:heme exporter protein C
MIWKSFLFLLLAFVSVAGITFPIVEKPAAWYEFPLIPGLEENAKIIFFHVPTAWLSHCIFNVYNLQHKVPA